MEKTLSMIINSWLEVVEKNGKLSEYWKEKLMIETEKQFISMQNKYEILALSEIITFLNKTIIIY